MIEDKKTKAHMPALVYGNIIYWGNILSAIIVIFGSLIAFTSMSNVMEPGYVFSSILDGKTSTSIWEGGHGSLPSGHWYMSELIKGDGLTMFGLALGIFVVMPALFGAAIFLMKDREYLFGLIAIIIGMITLFSFLGIFSF